MRLAEEKIKQAILHPDKTVREVAIRYFSRPTTRDPGIMPLAIRALEQYGKRQAFSFNHYINRLPQTETTIDWCVAELHREFSGDPIDRYFYFYDLSRLLCYADLRLVVPRAAEILHAPGFDPQQHVTFQERLEMFGWNGDKCWSELYRFCEAEKEKVGIENFGIGHASRIVEALARQPHPYQDQMLSILAQEVEDYRHDPRKWLQPMIAELAGEMNLRMAIPLLVSRLGHPSSILSDHCMFALARMGGDEVVEAVCQRFPNAVRDYRLYASELLGRLHSDAAVRWVLELMPHEREYRCRLNLCEALLNHFSFEGLEPARRFILKSPLTPDVRALRSVLVATSTITEARFPEYEQWQIQARDDAQEDAAKLREFDELAYETKGDMAALVKKMKAKMAVSSPLVPAKPAMPQRIPSPRRPGLFRPKRVGRNDPCPCGSGKKYKQCCMKR